MSLPQDIEDNILSTARGLIGIEWGHNQSSDSQLDCVRFLEKVAVSTGFDIELPPKNYNPTPSGNELFDYLDRNFIKKDFNGDISIIENCDVLVFKYFNVPHHVAIASTGLGNERYIIHASGSLKKITEHVLNNKLINKLLAVYTLDLNRYVIK